MIGDDYQTVPLSNEVNYIFIRKIKKKKQFQLVPLIFKFHSIHNFEAFDNLIETKKMLIKVMNNSD